MNRKTPKIALAALLIAGAAAAGWETPLYTYLSAEGSQSAAELVVLAAQEGRDSYQTVNASFNDGSAYKAYYDLQEDPMGREPERGADNQSSSYLPENEQGPLFYFTREQTDAFESSRRSLYKARVPDFTVRVEAALWMGSCYQWDNRKDELNRPPSSRDVFDYLVGIASGASANRPSILPNSQNGLEPRMGALVGGLRPEAYIKGATMNIASTSRDAEKFFRPETRPEFFAEAQNPQPLLGDIVFVGQFKGPNHFKEMSFQVYGQTLRGQPIEAETMFFNDGTFVTIFPCADVQSIFRTPAVLQFSFNPKRKQRILPLRLAGDKFWKAERLSLVRDFPEQIRLGLRPSTWVAEKHLDSGTPEQFLNNPIVAYFTSNYQGTPGTRLMGSGERPYLPPASQSSMHEYLDPSGND